MKKITLFLTFLFFTISLCAQKKTTTVKGYYRKDGKYIKSHTRTYNSRSTSKKRTNNSKTIPDANIFDLIAAIKEVRAMNEHKPKTKKGKNISHIAATDSTDIIDIFYLDAYVLTYNDLILDILPIPQDYHNFTPTYQFHKDKIPADKVIELISKYDWTLRNDILKKTYYKSGKTKDPHFLTKTKEVIPLIIEKEETTEVSIPDTTTVTDIFYLDFSILRYNDHVVDILPIPRDYPNIFKPEHEFDKTPIPNDLIMEMVSDHRWQLKKNTLSKTYYGIRYESDPTPLKRANETIPLFITPE